MPDDFDSRIDSLSAPSSSPSAGDDFDSRIDSLSAPKQAGTDWNAAAKSFAGNVLPGLAELPEQALNAYQGMARNMPGGPPLASQILSNNLPGINQWMGRPPLPYLDATNALKNMPLPGSVFQGQTPNQLAQQNPTAAGLGNAAGQIPALSTVGGPALEGLPWLGRVAASALGGGALTAGSSALQEASDQAKYNDSIDGQLVAQAAANGFGPGAIMGGLLGAFSKGAKPPQLSQESKLLAPTPPPAQPKLIEMKGPLVPPGPTERLQQQGQKLFGHTEAVHGEVMPPAPTNPINPNVSQLEKVRQLEQLSKDNEPLLKGVLENIDKQIGSRSKHRLKKPDRIIDKVNRPATKAERPWFDVEHINDALGFRTVVSNLNQAGKVLQLTAQHFEILKVDNKFAAPTKFGWRAINVDVRMPNGQIAEYSIMPPELEKVSHEMHELYEKWRGKLRQDMSKAEFAQWEKDQARSLSLGKGAWLRYLARTGKGERAALDSLSKVLASSGPTSRNRLMMYSPYQPGERVQVPSAKRPAYQSSATTSTSPLSDLQTSNINKLPLSTPIIPPTSDIADRVHNITTEDSSWREWRDIKTRPPSANELPLLKGLANLKIELDTAEGKLRGAIKAILDELGLPTPTRKHLTPEAWKILNKAQKDAGGQPGKKVAYTEATMAPGDESPAHYDFTSKSLMGRINEIDTLDKEYTTARANYDKYKEDREARFAETMPINDVVKLRVNRDGKKAYDINIKRVWRNSKFTWADLTEPKEIAALRESLKTDYPEINTENFVKVVQQAANRGNLPHIEYLADLGALDWFRRFDSHTQAKIVLAVGLTASIMLANQPQAQAAPPPNLLARVVKKLYDGGFKEWMGSGPITYITKLEMQTDMVSKGFDAASKKYFADRMAYMSALERSNLGARKMTDAEKLITKGMQPWQLRRANLPGWTSTELSKAGDIADLNQRMKETTAAEVERLKNLGVNAEHIGRAERYALGVHHDAHDQGVDLGYNPQGYGSEAMNMITGHVMEATALGNYGWVIDHAFEALLATASKYPGATKEAFKGLITNPLYGQFLEANSPAGFFEQMLDAGKGFKYRQKIDKFVNQHIDAAMEKYLGKEATAAIAGKLPERAKLGLNGLVITVEEAKNYPGGAEQYMRDWLANAKNRTAVPQARQLEFDKTALKIQIEKNIATGFVPEGPISEKTVFQRTGAFSLGISFTRGKIQQSRFVASLMDDALRQAANDDWWGVAKSMRAIMYAHLFLFGAAGSAFVPSYVWFALEQADRARYGTTKDVQEIKDALDKAQKNIGPGYQKRELGPAGAPLTGAPSGAVMSLVNSLQRDFPPKDKIGYVKLIADATTLLLLSRIGPIGNLNLRYMLSYFVKGGKGEDYTTSEKGIISQLAAAGAKKPQILGTRHIGMTKTEGIVKALTRATTPEEVKEIQRAEKISAKRLPGLLKKTGKNLLHGLKH